jgi:Recombinase
MNLDMIRRRLSKINLRRKVLRPPASNAAKNTELDREGRSFASIAHYLNEHGFTSASGKSWNRGMVAHLLYGTPDASGSHWRTLENIHYRVITEARARGLDYREIATEFNKRQIRRRGGPALDSKVCPAALDLNRVQRQPKK